MKILRQLGQGTRVLIAVAVASGAGAQEWPHPGGDAGGTKHSAVDQINRENVARLEVAWTFDTGDWSDGSELPSRSATDNRCDTTRDPNPKIPEGSERPVGATRPRTAFVRVLGCSGVLQHRGFADAADRAKMPFLP